MPSQIGLILRHRNRGFGKVTNFDGSVISVRFADGTEANFGKSAVADGELERAWLPINAECSGSQGICRIVARVESNDPAHQYEVRYESGLKGMASEFDLVPAVQNEQRDPISLLVNGSPFDYAVFRSREALVEAGYSMLRAAGGLRALLSSRIDLRLHQAYVASVVIPDWRRRYILADEVGLGKTIEAGIVIHDLLSRKPAARVLVICPGTLTQQWLCEIYSKFGGQIFSLLDLHKAAEINWSGLSKVIVSTTLSLDGDIGENLRKIDWDMLIVDEAHHVLGSRSLYSLIETLSKKTKSVLLLSAIPTQQREKELLQLLALVEPDRYRQGSAAEIRKFTDLYAAQADIGRRIRLLTRRIEGLTSGECSMQEVLTYAERLLELSVLRDDAALLSELKKADMSSPKFAEAARWLVHEVASRYRISRRLLRNRRQRLVEQQQIVAIERKPAFHPYESDQLELDAIRAVQDLLLEATTKGPAEELVACNG